MINTDSLATAVLEEWGCSVIPLPTHDVEQSDFLVVKDNQRYLIEEKTKLDDPESEIRRREVLASGQPHVRSDPLLPNNRLSGVVKKAVSQLTSSSGLEHDFRLIWFTALGMNAESKFNQFVATLYGTTNIVEMNQTQLRRCYFFRNSEFFRHRNTLDAAIVAGENGDSFTLSLCLNPLSPRYSRLRESGLSNLFANGVQDPLKEEENGIAYIVDSDIDRRKEADVLAYLQHKYRTNPLMKMDLGYHSVSTVI